MLHSLTCSRTPGRCPESTGDHCCFQGAALPAEAWCLQRVSCSCSWSPCLTAGLTPEQGSQTVLWTLRWALQARQDSASHAGLADAEGILCGPHAPMQPCRTAHWVLRHMHTAEYRTWSRPVCCPGGFADANKYFLHHACPLSLWVPSGRRHIFLQLACQAIFSRERGDSL